MPDRDQTLIVPPPPPPVSERFQTRARALFWARLAFLGTGLAVLAVPAWREVFHVEGRGAIAIYMIMVAYSALNYAFIGNGQLGKVLTFVTLCLDLVVLIFLIAVSGGLHSPLIASQLLFTVLFVTLFPTPLAVVPPLLTFPIMAKIDDVLGRVGPTDVFILLWFSGINCIVVYVLVYLDQRDQLHNREVSRLQAELKDFAVLEERGRLAREIHDGLGGALSSMIIQTEYLESLATDPLLKSEIHELRGAAEDSIEELRRALKAMRGDLELVPALDEWCRTAAQRHKLNVAFTRDGVEREVSPEVALAVFRVLQEALTNVARHAEAKTAAVALQYGADALLLRIVDDGKGFDPTAPSPLGHYGLANMRERARKVGGEMRVESSPGAGAAVSIIVPLRNRGRDANA